MASQAAINDLQAQLMQRSRELDHVQSSRQELSQQLEAIQLHCQSLESQVRCLGMILSIILSPLLVATEEWRSPSAFRRPG